MGSEVYVINCANGSPAEVATTVLHEAMHNLRGLGSALHTDPQYGLGIFEQTGQPGLVPNPVNLRELGRGLRSVMQQWTAGFAHRNAPQLP